MVLLWYFTKLSARLSLDYFLLNFNDFNSCLMEVSFWKQFYYYLDNLVVFLSLNMLVISEQATIWRYL